MRFNLGDEVSLVDLVGKITQIHYWQGQEVYQVDCGDSSCLRIRASHLIPLEKPKEEEQK